MAQTWLVTGANRGLGLEFARQLTQNGHTVIATARNPEDAPELRETGARVEQLDIADQRSIDALRDRLRDQPIDVLVNNAALGGEPAPLEELDFQVIERHFRVNSVAPLRVTRALLPNLRAGRGRKVATITSRMGSIELAGSTHYAYCAGKAGLNMLMKIASNEVRDITFLLLHPGWVRTRMGGREAPLEPPESVRGMLERIEEAGPERSGSFVDYQGERVPW